MKKWRDVMLIGAEIMDAWRIIPRLIVASYGYMIYELFLWYTNIPTHTETRCNDALVTTLINNDIPIDRAMEMACSVIDTVGGPTTQQTSFVTVIIGLSSAMFAFYVNSGGGEWQAIRDKDDSVIFSNPNSSDTKNRPD